jgi:hypothetical protein
MTIDQETEEILERIKDDIEDRLSEKPFWADDLLHVASGVQKNIERLSSEILKTYEAIEENKELSKSLHVLKGKNVERVSSELLKTYEAIEENKDLSKSLFSVIEKNVERVSVEILKICEAIEENKELSDSLYTMISEQQVALSTCHKKLDYILMPWWRRLFRRKP